MTATYCNDVTPWLTTGGDLSLAHDLTGVDPLGTIADLVGRGVTHVLDVRSEWSDDDLWQEVSPSIRYHHAPIVDSDRYKPTESWYTSVEMFVARFIASHKPGDRLYVHCHMGVNRGPSAAMVALLVANPALDPYAAFRLIREVRPQAGLVYAEEVGRRHLSDDADALAVFERKMAEYWTPQRIADVNRGIAYYRTLEGGTLQVNGMLRVNNW